MLLFFSHAHTYSLLCLFLKGLSRAPTRMRISDADTNPEPPHVLYRLAPGASKLKTSIYQNQLHEFEQNSTEGWLFFFFLNLTYGGCIIKYMIENYECSEQGRQTQDTQTLLGRISCLLWDELKWPIYIVLAPHGRRVVSKPCWVRRLHPLAM